MLSRLAFGTGTLAAVTLLVAVSAFPVQAQYRYGYRGDVYGYGPYSYSPRTFDDYVDLRTRQLRLQRLYGTPYYGYPDRGGYYDNQRFRSDIYRPYYEGRRFRYNRPDYDYQYRYRYDFR